MLQQSYILAAVGLALIVSMAGCGQATSQAGSAPSPAGALATRYDMGSPVLLDIWVDPVGGDDANTGQTRQQALKTLRAAWRKVPANTPLARTGYRLMLVEGTYPVEAGPVSSAPAPTGRPARRGTATSSFAPTTRLAGSGMTTTSSMPSSRPFRRGPVMYFEQRKGAFRCPVVFQSADGPGKAVLPATAFSDCSYVYLLGLKFVTGGRQNVLQFGRCDHILVRNVTAVGLGELGERQMAPHECLKIGGDEYMFIEDSDFSGAWDNAIDCVAVRYSHFIGCKIHHSYHEAMYVKGGSAYILVADNEIYGSHGHGFMAGQSTGFEFMKSPWIHYEAYDIRFVNNVVHDTDCCGMAVCGGYNVLLADNTLYRVGKDISTILVGLGFHSCDSNIQKCKMLLAQGGWCELDVEVFNIPNKNVFIYNNLVFNPPGYGTAQGLLTISGPATASPASNIPNPARADDNLQIRGNIIWSGDQATPLLDGRDKFQHLVSKSTYDTNLLRRYNAINTVTPELADPEHGDFRPVPGSMAKAKTYPIPDFTWDDAPKRPAVPQGQLDNRIMFNRAGQPRTTTTPAGAY